MISIQNSKKIATLHACLVEVPEGVAVGTESMHCSTSSCLTVSSSSSSCSGSMADGENQCQSTKRLWSWMLTHHLFCQICSYILHTCSLWSIQRRPSRDEKHTISQWDWENRNRKRKKSISQYFLRQPDFLQLHPLLCRAEAGVVFVMNSSCSQHKQKYLFICAGKTTKHKSRFKIHTPISGRESEAMITLGANARGFLDSICLRVARTVSSWMGLLKQSIQAHGSTQ